MSTGLMAEQGGTPGSGKVSDNCLLKSHAELAARWFKVESFVMDDPEAQEPFSYVLKDRMFWSDELAELVVLEYKKYMLLCSIFPDENMTPSVHVDTVWHLHLIYTHSYFRFCQDALDCFYIHHEPSRGGKQDEAAHVDSYALTLDRYKETFGVEAPLAVWGARIRSELDAGIIDGV